MPVRTSFTKRRLDVQFVLAEGAFADDASGLRGNSVTISGLRVSAEVLDAGTPSAAHLALRVWGLTLSQTNQLSTLGQVYTEVRRNLVAVYAGDDEHGKALLFGGTITRAAVDFNQMPEVVFSVQASTGKHDAIKAVSPTSYNGPVDVATVMAGLAALTNRRFENNGVSVMLSSPYFPGTADDQIKAAARAAGIEVHLFAESGTGGTLAIWPRGGAREQTAVAVGPRTGMIGYPSFDPLGIEIETLYNPAIQFGGLIEVESSLAPACGQWVVRTLSHTLESEIAGGAWLSRINGVRRPYAVSR